MFRLILEKRVIATIDNFFLEKRVVTTIHEEFLNFFWKSALSQRFMKIFLNLKRRTSDLEKSKKHDQIIHLRKIIWKSVVLKTEHLENGGNPNFGFQQVTLFLLSTDLRIKLSESFLVLWLRGVMKGSADRSKSCRDLTELYLNRERSGTVQVQVR